MELTNEKKEEILKALTVIQEVCNLAPNCACCPLRTQSDNCTVRSYAPHQWDIDTVHQDWRAFR